MKVKVTFDEKGYVASWCEMGEIEGSQEYEVDGMLWNDYWYAFRLEAGQLVYDETYKTIFIKHGEIQEKINQLKKLLKDTDYKALKYAEGWLSTDEFKETLDQRQLWRNQINELESELETL